MQLIINGQMSEVPDSTLAEVLKFLGHSGSWFAVAVDGVHVPKHAWSETALDNFQTLEILSPMQGG